MPLSLSLFLLTLTPHTIPKSLEKNLTHSLSFSLSLSHSYVFCASELNNHQICTIVGIDLNEGCVPSGINNFVVNKNHTRAWGFSCCCFDRFHATTYLDFAFVLFYISVILHLCFHANPFSVLIMWLAPSFFFLM